MPRMSSPMSTSFMPSSSRRGAFITLEGGEGAGKTTQARYIADRLRAKGIVAVTTREPGGSPRAEILRDVLLAGTLKHLGAKAEAIVFSAARIDHIDYMIGPALAAGTWVICDRFADSTRVYQGTFGGGNVEIGLPQSFMEGYPLAFKPIRGLRTTSGRGPRQADVRRQIED